MSDYQNLGLNDQLQPTNSIPAQESQAVTGYDANSNYERNSITDLQIRNLNFGKGQGGTLTLGGSNNGEGVLEIKNSSGSTVVQGDNTGITIKDSRGTTIIDATGLVSNANFLSQIAIIGTSQTTLDHNIGYTMCSGGTITLSRTRTSVYLIGMTANCHNEDAHNGHTCLFRFTIGGTTVGPDVVQGGQADVDDGATYVNDLTATGLFIQTVGAGTTDLNLSFATDGFGTSVITVGQQNQLFAIKLGN